ncbi:hypothetical protein MKW98_005996 [Papaver atlanticum]|uniref:Glucan endo-1,3-beta-D-glucosidase n=1 Tax=Papaver atlanticum TaxID=357466 RepID=A0AAD4S6C7_9MAGN|nr:hypothetical protein MKW98_005996 [Papaver atlanticum]
MKVRRFRLFDPNPDLLNYFNGTQAIFTIAIGTLDRDIEKLAMDPNFAKAWVSTNIVRYPRVKFNYIVVGNEMIPTNVSKYVLQAMINMNTAVKQSGLPQSIKVTTVVAMGVLGVSYPPSAAFLAKPGFPLFLNVYPYFAYASNPSKIRLDYALFNTTDVVVQDGNLQYKNLFYAMVDSMIWAVEKEGGANVEIVVSETGWPSAGNAAVATVEHAKMYINNMITTLMKSGTPKRPEHAMRTHIFAMFNEDKKAEGVERNFGIYRPDLAEVYHVNWPPTASCDIGNQ